MDSPKKHDPRMPDIEFRLLAEYSTDIVYTQDLTTEQKITYVSPSAKDILGYSVEEATGMPVKKLLTEESYAHQARRLNEKLSRREEISKLAEMLEVQLVCKDGTVIWGETHARLVTNAEGNPVGIMGVMRDVTERKASEERERQYYKNTEWLRNSAIELIQLPTVEAIFHYIGESLSQMVDQGVTIINEIREEENVVIPRHIYGLKYRSLEQFIQWLGLHPVGKEYPLTRKLKHIYHQEKIIPIRGDLVSFGEGFHPEEALRKIEQYLNLKQIYTIGLKRDNRLLAAIHILKFDRPEIVNIRFVETFLNQASITLQRKMLE